MYIKRSEEQSVDLSCTPEQTGGTPVSLYLTHRCVRPEREVLFMAKDQSSGTVRVNRLYKDRLKVTGGLNSDLLNVTIAHLQRTDTGLYICEFVYTADPSDRTFSGSLEFFLFVEGTGTWSWLGYTTEKELSVVTNRGTGELLRVQALSPVHPVPSFSLGGIPTRVKRK